MLRRLIAAALALSIAVPLPALAGLAGSGCTMDTPALAAERCECCTAPMATGPSPCGATSGASGCGCELRADTRPDSRSAVTSTASPTVTFSVHGDLLPADLSTPRRTQRHIALAASPPGAGALVSRPVLCSWII
jgi:hypothetical protein